MEPTAVSYKSAVNIMTILFSIVSSQFRECNRKLEAYSKSFSPSTYFCTNHEGSSENWAFFFFNWKAVSSNPRAGKERAEKKKKPAHSQETFVEVTLSKAINTQLVI